MKKQIQYIADSFLNSYAILFFSQNKVLGALLLIASFFNPFAGLSGLACCGVSIGVASVLGYSKYDIRTGLYSFNALLLGIGVGTFYHFGAAYIIWLGAACIVVSVLSFILVALFRKYNLPLLSLPFIITFWLLLLSANGVYHMGLVQRNSAVLNELFSPVRDPKLGDGWLHLPFYPALFFRALSALLFQNNIVSGIIIAIGLLIHSRINFSLMVIGFVAAVAFNGLTGTYPEGISYYHLGANFMLASGAVGCFFFIPSGKSYLAAILTIPLVFLLINAFTRIFGQYDLPILSLPFCVITLLVLLLFRLNGHGQFLQLTPIQHYSPERNLYQFTNAKERLDNLKYFRFGLPFLGTWHVSQGHGGDLTHKGDWAQALDFVLQDNKGHTCRYPGERPEDFYCFAKPVLACADGVVTEVTDMFDDNKIGEVDLEHNWGNSIIIKHLDGLYSQVSHLKKKSVKVKPGDIVKTGDVVALCGNSGRSPEPHLHFQLQANPYVGSKTISYPLAYYMEHKNGKAHLASFEVPSEGTDISAVEISTSLRQAFNFPPGFTFQLSVAGSETESFEVFTDAFNQTYIYGKTTGATAYFINNGTSFYFTSFYGSHNSVLFYLYLAAYKVVFTEIPGIVTTDSYPLQIKTGKAALWLQDLLAPFEQFIRLRYESFCEVSGRNLTLQSKQIQDAAGKTKMSMSASTHIQGNEIKSLSITIDNSKIDLEWSPGNTY